MSELAPEFEYKEDVIGQSRFGIVSACYNQSYVNQLCDAVTNTLLQYGADTNHIERHNVPGSSEIPYLANMLALSGEYDALIALGVVIAGDTRHHEVIEQTTAQALQQIALNLEVPVINGIITTNTFEQAEKRCGDSLNRGREFAKTAMVMAQHKQVQATRLSQLDLQERVRRGSVENN